MFQSNFFLAIAKHIEIKIVAAYICTCIYMHVYEELGYSQLPITTYLLLWELYPSDSHWFLTGSSAVLFHYKEHHGRYISLDPSEADLMDNSASPGTPCKMLTLKVKTISLINSIFWHSRNSQSVQFCFQLWLIDGWSWGTWMCPWLISSKFFEVRTW